LNPVADSQDNIQSGKVVYLSSCSGCHGEDGKARTPLAGSLPVRPTDLTDYLMESMREGEVYWVVTYGIDQSAPANSLAHAPGTSKATVFKNMPAFGGSLNEVQRWQAVLYVRELRRRQKTVEVERLGPYQWDLPPGFPYPNVPADNPMTAEKVELGRRLFYDRRLSVNEKQSCATCHQQGRAFADTRGRGRGTTGELHPRGPMSLANVAYSPVLTWANPNMRKLEAQALVPMFGEDPVELGMSGKEDVLLSRLKTQPLYWSLFPKAYPAEADPFTLGNVTKAIASFERTILSGDSPYDRYRRGDDPNAISDSAKRGETLFFSERLECFHCHGGFNFTGTLDYYGKGFAEVEFHNTGLYNLPGKFSYPEPNPGLYTFSQEPADVGKFKAPTLRNIELTAPYMHDGSIATLSEAIDHYAAGGRKIKDGPYAGDGAANPNRSEFVKGFSLSAQEKEEVLAFLKSLTDETLLTNPRLSNPWTRMPALTQRARPVYMIHGEVAKIYSDEGAVALYHDEVPGLMGATRAPASMEFVVENRDALKKLKVGQTVTAAVRRQGRDFVLSDLNVVHFLLR
jgi:cytochrome c peroxidase